MDWQRDFEQLRKINVLNLHLQYSIRSEMNKFQDMAHRKDLPILTVALKAEANYLVTFDIEDFNPDPKLGLVVCKPGRLLNEIRRKLMELAEK